MKKEFVNEKNRFLFYNQNGILVFKEQKIKQNIMLPTEYINCDLGAKNYELFYNDFLNQYLKNQEFLLKSVSIQPMIRYENTKLKKDYLRKIYHYYIIKKVFIESEWMELQKSSAQQNLDIEIIPITDLLELNLKEYSISENDTKACEILKRKLVKESE